MPMGMQPLSTPVRVKAYYNTTKEGPLDAELVEYQDDGVGVIRILDPQFLDRRQLTAADDFRVKAIPYKEGASIRYDGYAYLVEVV